MRIQTSDLVLDTDARSVEVGGVPLRLTRKEFRILELLTLNRPAGLGKQAIFDDLYGDTDDPPEIRIIDVFIAVLRKKLANVSGRSDRHRIVAVDDAGVRLVEARCGSVGTAISGDNAACPCAIATIGRRSKS